MRAILGLLLALVAVECLAQEQGIPTERIVPQDVEQSTIRMGRISTNSFAVLFTYTEAGAKKMLAFRREHAGHEVLTHIGSFEIRASIMPLESGPLGWTEEGWLKWRTDKVFGISEDDAKKIVEGLKSK
jgi:hypothetical protein